MEEYKIVHIFYSAHVLKQSAMEEYKIVHIF